MIDTAKAAARIELLFNKLNTVCETSKLDLTKQSAAKFIAMINKNLIPPKVAARLEFYLTNLPQFVGHLNQIYAVQCSATKFIAMIGMSLITAKAEARLELLFNKLATVC